MEISRELREAIEAELSAVQSKRMLATVSGLSKSYRERAGSGQRIVASRESALAYTAYRMPATFAAVNACLSELSERLPGFQPATLLDAGSGPGTALWAAASLWRGLREARLYEREDDMIATGKALALRSSLEVLHHAIWTKADIAETSFGECDLVVSAYVLTELPAESAFAVVERLWGAARGALLIVEPGTPAGFARVRQYRELLISLGAVVAAPCPHANACPMPDTDWCHFAQRVERSKLHREVKAAELPYEDEKFSYIAVSREPSTPISGRVLRHPQVRPGHIKFSLCTQSGIELRTVTRSDKALFKQARDSRWGGTMPGDVSRGT